MEQDRKMAETERKAQQAADEKEDKAAKREAKKEEAQRRREEHADRMKSRELDRELKKADSKRKAESNKERRENERAETARKAEKERKSRADAAEKKKQKQVAKELKYRKDLTKKDVDRLKSIRVGFDQVSDDDKTATAMSKFGANVGRAAGAIGKAAFFGGRALYRKSREGKVGQEPKKTPNKVTTSTPTPSAGVKTQKALPGRKDPERKALPAAKSAPERKALPPAKSAPERKALPGRSQKALPPARTGGALADKKVTSIVSTKPKESDAQRARRDPEFRKKLIKMREEFLYEVEKMKKEKVEKVIDIMRGRNKIEVNPKLGESYLLVQDLADYKPLEIETVDVIKADPIKPTQSNWRAEIEEASAAWTRKAGKSKSGGLNEKGRKSYERENPGSDLKAPSKKVGNPRRKSFCARMKGMKKKLTSSKTANDPNSRINKSLRAWNC